MFPSMPKRLRLALSLALGLNTIVFDVSAADKTTPSLCDHCDVNKDSALEPAAQPDLVSYLAYMNQHHIIVDHTKLMNWTTYHGRVDVGGYYRHNPAGVAELDALLPLLQNETSLLYLDLRGLKFSGSAQEFNAGVGYRSLTPTRNWMWGVYGFFDRKRSQFNRYFNQFTIGAELKDRAWDWNANVYLPTGTSSYVLASSTTSATTVGLTSAGGGLFNISVVSNTVTGVTEEKSMPGFDTELGYSSPYTPNFYAYAGYYLFYRKPIGTMAGPRIRLTYDYIPKPGQRVFGVFNKITAEGMYRHDRIERSQYYIGARFRISIGKQKPLMGMQKHMLDYVRRDMDVVAPSVSSVSTIQEEQLFTHPDTGVPMTLQIITSVGELESSTANIMAVWTDFTNVDTVELRPGQGITGGDITFQQGGTIYTFSAPSQGSLTAALDAPLIAISQNNVITNITLNRNSADWNNSRTIYNPVGNDDFGDLEIRGVHVTGPIEVQISNNGTGNVGMVNSEVELGALVGLPNPTRDTGAVSFVANDSAALRIEVFDGNTITTSGADAHGLTSHAEGAGTVVFNGGIKNNQIITSANNTHALLNTAANGSTLTIQGDFTGNILTGAGTGNVGIYNRTTGTGQINIYDGITNNTLSTTEADTILNRNYAAGGVINISGDITGNTATVGGVGSEFFAAYDATGTLNYTLGSNSIMYS